jgi:EAL domain-containing protein (putative c-di-GMP-specific phosphodiesterase class I)/CRP-like cAMP-binding protein
MERSELQVSFQPGEYIFEEGDPGDCAYIIESGMVEVTLNRAGQETVIATLGKGDVLGEIALIDHLPRSGSARAASATVATEIPLEYFTQKIEQADPTIRMFLRIVMSRYRDLNSRLARVVASLPRATDRKKNGASESTTSQLQDVASQFRLMQQQIDAAVKKPAQRDAHAGLSENTLEMTRVSLNEEKLLREAVEQQQFVMHYQPVIQLDRKRIVGCEALIRWQHPSGELMSPAHFMDKIENSELIFELGDWITAEACRFQRRVYERFKYDFFVAINLSGRQFGDANLARNLSGIIEKTNARRANIEFEVTESLLMDNPEMASRALHELKGIGVRLSIDDFGTGYSSFSYLHRYPFDKLKIDRSFVSAMARSAKSNKIVKSLINLAHDMDMQVVAEGAEKKDEVDILRTYGADYGQGYYFSRPIDEAAFIKLITPRKKLAASI